MYYDLTGISSKLFLKYGPMFIFAFIFITIGGGSKKILL